MPTLFLVFGNPKYYHFTGAWTEVKRKPGNSIHSFHSLSASSGVLLNEQKMNKYSGNEQHRQQEIHKKELPQPESS
jgi:hypothetical protein